MCVCVCVCDCGVCVCVCVYVFPLCIAADDKAAVESFTCKREEVQGQQEADERKRAGREAELKTVQEQLNEAHTQLQVCVCVRVCVL